MDLKKSRDTFWIIDGLFKLLAVGCFAWVIYLAVQLFGYQNPVITDANRIVVIGLLSEGGLTASQQDVTNTLMAMPQLLVWGIAFWLGSRIFYDLSENRTPFSKTIQKRIDWIAKSVLGLAIFYPVIYSLIATVVAGEINLYLTFDLSLIMGLVLSSIAAIFRYAISLQELADDTV
ncbi:hypothetical protein JZO70_17550 [Enterococcus sp. 669A]|uniref:DUF2975 domain-containing protein n=1 Tax=Candidatus Enterococcus moelleringii TaxID=2815325 RepID=A0ABS3LHY1_9ENTE|nr:hypothetical protein [Enterococcus sp. 669A]MBO1307984.1 hypothetical protein [Enterococcus sp. 669A]